MILLIKTLFKALLKLLAAVHRILVILLRQVSVERDSNLSNLPDAVKVEQMRLDDFECQLNLWVVVYIHRLIRDANGIHDLFPA